MSALVLDTHALIWYLGRSPHLSRIAHAAIKSAIGAAGVLHIPAVSLAEIIYLEEKGRVAAGTYGLLAAELMRLNTPFVVVPFDSAVANAMLKIPRDQVPDMPDRMIAATAAHLGLPLVTADAKIRATRLATIW